MHDALGFRKHGDARRPLRRLSGRTGCREGSEVVVLGRTGDDRWALVPASAFGTADARREMIFDDVAPAPLAAERRRPAGPV